MTSRTNFKNSVMGLIGQKGNTFWDYFGVECDWCAEFVSYCMRELAHISWFPKSASCCHIKSQLSQRVNFDYKTAEIGDIILFETHNPDDGPEHIGMVIANNPTTKMITTIEGNTGSYNFKSSSVNIYQYPYDSKSFDCIVDMSSEFADDDELTILQDKIARIRAIILE